MRLGLEPMREACARFGHPERAFEAVHVAGTNGKGSVCAMVESIARAARARRPASTRRRTSAASPSASASTASRSTTRRSPTLLERALDGAPDLSFFETATLAAFLAFRDARVDVAIVEVGIGGRLDATNVLPAPARRRDHAHRPRSHRSPRADPRRHRAREGRHRQARARSRRRAHGPPDVRAAIDAVARAHGATTTRPRATAPLPARIGLDGRLPAATTRASPRLLGARIGASPAAIARGHRERPLARAPRAHRRRPARRRPQPRRRRGPGAPRALARRPARRRRARLRRARRQGLGGHARRARSPRGHARLRRSARGRRASAIDPARLAARHAGVAATSVADAVTRAAAERRVSLVVVAGSLVLRRRGARRCCWGCRGIRPSRFEDGPRCGYIASPWIAMPSFDIVSKVQRNEVDNAYNQARERDRAALRLQGHRDRAREERRGHHHPLRQRGSRQGRARACCRTSS